MRYLGKRLWNNWTGSQLSLVSIIGFNSAEQQLAIAKDNYTQYFFKKKWMN